jgi:GAF domain-containing protein
VAARSDFPDRLLANCASLLYFGCRPWWVEFYRVLPSAGAPELVLGPFHGPVACVRIPFGAGVCGTAWRDRRLINVPDVDAFPGHIACSSASRSELVVPIFRQGDPALEVVGVLDLDSTTPADFDATDEAWMVRVAEVVGRRLYPLGPP